MNTTPQTLQELAQAAIDHQGISARGAAMRAEQRGLRLTHTTLNQMRSGTYKSEPRVETIRALAWLAGVSEEVAFTAAGQPVPGPPLADELPDGADNLSPKSRRVIIDMLRVLIDLESNHDKDTHPAGHQDRERESADDGPVISSGEKTGGVGLDQMDFDLAAHPDMPLERDRFDAEHGDSGEENQDRD